MTHLDYEKRLDEALETLIKLKSETDEIGDHQSAEIFVQAYDEAVAALTKLTEERELLARIDELSQHFLDTDELCIVDTITKEAITVKQRKDILYEELEDAEAK